MRRITVTLDDVTDGILRRAAPNHGDEAPYVRRAIIAQAERDALRAERDLAAEVDELRTRVAELERLIVRAGG